MRGFTSLLAILFIALPLSSLQAAEEVQSVGNTLDSNVETVEFHNTPIEDILRLLARQHDLNLIIGPDSMGSVSLRLSGVTLRSALDAILRSKGFQYQLYENIMLVMKPDSLEKLRGLGMETRLFRLKYTDARDLKTVIDTSRVLSPWGYSAIFSRAVATEAVKAGVLRPQTDPTISAAINVSDPIQTGQSPLKSRSDILLVTDRPLNLAKVAALIEQIDRRQRQVAIDVKFVETTIQDDQTTGIDWQQLLSVQGAYKGKTQWTLGGASSLGGAGAGTIQLGALDGMRFDAVLDMLLKNQKAKLLSQPRVSTIDNQPATIGVGLTTWIEERSGDVSTGALTITYSERRIPIELVVVPHILEGDLVMLELRPVVEEITGWQDGAQGQKLPIISSRTADTRIEIKDGETAVIGGLLKDKTISTTKKIWLLGSLPLIGHLFQHKVESVERTDLSIFITPRIVKEGESPFQAPKEEPPPAQDSVESEAPAPVKKAAEKTATNPEIVDIRPYFPFSADSKWTYQWKDENGTRWLSKMVVREQVQDHFYTNESVPDGIYQSNARTCYRWREGGLENLFKTNVGKDSTYYQPARQILPASMEIDKTYENTYKYTIFGIGGQKSGVGEVKQIQRLLKRDAVALSNARYKDCIVIETVWYNLGEKNGNGAKKRKLIWYARDIGPVKVEHDLPLDQEVVKGKMSALLAKR